MHFCSTVPFVRTCASLYRKRRRHVPYPMYAALDWTLRMPLFPLEQGKGGFLRAFRWRSIKRAAHR
jgi:hypothetical protein